MSVRFKFKNDLEYNAVPCDGFHISVLDLKRTIIRSKRLGRVTDFDLQITNQQTSEVYSSEEDLIPKNSTLIIVRVPLSHGQKKIWEAEKLPSTTVATGLTSERSFTSASEGISEEDKLNTMMSNSTEMYDPKNWVRYRGKAAFAGKPPPLTYRCNRCHQTGHWVQDCALIKAGIGGQELKKTTGIPRSFLKPANIDTPGAKINPQGMYMVNELEIQAYRDRKVDKPVWDNDDAASSMALKLEIPSDLKCPVCHDLLKDAIMLPTCACATCDECARNALIESDNNVCPVCNEPGNCPDDLIPCRKLRDKVNKFKNTSGYAAKAPFTNAPNNNVKSAQDATPTLPDIVLPNQFDTLRGNLSEAPLSYPAEKTSPTPQVPTAETSPYVNSPYANISENAPTPLTSEPPIPGVVDTEDEDVFKSKAPPRSPDTPPPKPSPNSSPRTPSPLRRRIRSPRSPLRRTQRSSRSPPLLTHPIYNNGVPLPVSLPDTSLPPPGFIMQTSLPTYLPPPIHGYISPHNPSFRGQPHHHPPPPIPPSARFPGRREPPPAQPCYIEDPLKTFNMLMAEKDQARYRSRSRSPRDHYRHSLSRRSPSRGNRYRHPPSPPQPRGPRTPPHPPRQSATPPPGDSPHHHHLTNVGSESPSDSPRGRHHTNSPRRRSSPPPSPSPRRHSPSPRRISRSPSHSHQRSRTPDQSRKYYDEENHRLHHHHHHMHRRPYHVNDSRHPNYVHRDNYSYREDYYRSRGPPRGGRGRGRGRGRGNYYEPLPRRTSTSPVHHQVNRSRREQRSFSNERTPSLSPEPENNQYYNYRYHQDHNKHKGDFHHNREVSQYPQDDARRAVSPPRRELERTEEFPKNEAEDPSLNEVGNPHQKVVVKKKKEKKKKRKKDDPELANEQEDLKKKKKKAKKIKSKKVEEDSAPVNQKFKDSSQDRDANMKGSEMFASSGRESLDDRLDVPPLDENDEHPSEESMARFSPGREIEREKKDHQEEMIELVPELSKWERDDLVAESSASPVKDRGSGVPKERNHDLCPENDEQIQDTDLRDVLKSKKSSKHEDSGSKKKKRKEEELPIPEPSESEDGKNPEEDEDENEETKKKKKKKKKQKEIEKKIERKLRKEIKKKMKEKLKRKKIRESTSSPLQSPSPPPKEQNHRRRDVKSDRGDSLRITIDRNNTESRSPSPNKRRRSSSPDENDRVRVSLLKMSGSDVRGSKSGSFRGDQQPSRKVSIKDRLGPIKRSRSRSLDSRRNCRDDRNRRREDGASRSREKRRFDDDDRNSRDRKSDSRSGRVSSALPSTNRKRSESRRSRDRDVSERKRHKSSSPVRKDTRKTKDDEEDYSTSKNKRKKDSTRSDENERNRKSRKTPRLKSRYENDDRGNRGYDSESN